MNSSDTSLLVMLCAIAAIIIVALAVVLFFTYRNAVDSRSLDERSPSIPLPPAQTWRPEPLPQPWSQQEDVLSPVEKKEPYILFGSDKPSVKKNSGKISWGGENAPYNSGLCPLCKNALGSKTTTTCKNCDAIYHKDCWVEFGGKCANCKKT
jgi:hypothetical protein